LKDLEFEHLTTQLDAHPPSWPSAIACLRRVDSTQRLARRYASTLAAEDERPPATAFVALEQTAGRGRQGNAWQSPAGRGLYASWLVVLPDAKTLASLPLRLGVALAAALSRAAGVEVRLKWPNDLWVSGRKAGGILIETFGAPEGSVVAVVGVGVNLGDWAEQDLIVASFTRPSWHEVFSAASAALRGILEEPESEPGIERERLAAVLIHRPGDRLRFRSSGVEIEGAFVGLDETGRLLLRLADGQVRAFASGEVVESVGGIG
jgi:BirA family biotin operon repressor/biotin-[acetyl-CoA-carboxylase] ligase